MSRRNRKNRSKGKWKRERKFNKHHILPKSRKGKATPQNLITLDIRRHEAWHLLFGLMTFREVAELLLRTCEIKHQRD